MQRNGKICSNDENSANEKLIFDSSKEIENCTLFLRTGTFLFKDKMASSGRLIEYKYADKSFTPVEHLSVYRLQSRYSFGVNK